MTGQKAADSDIRMLIATQVAYLDGEEDMSVGDLVNRAIANYGSKSNLSAQEQGQLNVARNIQERVNQYDLQDCYNWVIQKVENTNKETGFYGCLIDTQDGNAIIGFRGSEFFSEDNQFILDGIADIGLLNSTLTPQQAQAEAFTRYVNETYRNKYESFGLTGHSLGGNLAEHATITAPDGMRIHRCVSYDGPGYSDEYIAAHQKGIERRARYIDHYQCSAVGAILNSLPGTNYQTIAAQEEYFARHDTRNIDFDEYGNVQPGSMDEFAAYVGPLTKGIDDLPPGSLSAMLLLPFSPELAALALISQMTGAAVKDMSVKVTQIIVNIGETLGNLAQSVENWFRTLFGGVALTGEFEMNVSYVNSLGNGMEDVSGKLRRISGEISDITSKIRYQSMTGTYIKSRLKNLSGAVGRDATKASSLAKAARSCSQYTVNSDTQAAQLCKSV